MQGGPGLPPAGGGLPKLPPIKGLLPGAPPMDDEIAGGLKIKTKASALKSRHSLISLYAM